MNKGPEIKIIQPEFNIGDRVIAVKEKMGTPEYKANLGTIAGAYYKGDHEGWVYVVYIGNKQIIQYFEFEISLFGKQDHEFPNKTDELFKIRKEAKEKKRKKNVEPKQMVEELSQNVRINDVMRDEISKRIPNIQTLAFETGIPMGKLQKIWSGEEEITRDQVTSIATKIRVQPYELYKLALEEEVEAV